MIDDALPSSLAAAPFRALVEQMPAAAALFDRHRRCVVWSRCFQGECFGPSGLWDEETVRERWSGWGEAFQRALDGEAVEEEVPWQAAEGTEQWTRWVLQPWRDPQEAIAGVLVFTQLITPQKQVEANLLRACSSVEEMNHQLEEAITRANSLATEAAVADHAKSAFLAMMSHEIRTPLTGVIGMAHILEGTSLTEEQRDYLRIIQSSGEALLAVINDTLDYSKIEAGHLELEDEEFDLNELVEEVLELLASRAAAKGIELAAVVQDEVPRRVRGDVTRVRQVLLNLLGNAVKFTDEGEVVVEVARASADSGQPCAPCVLEVAVRDTGPGISAEQQTRLFRTYTQLDRSTARTHGGTGLGLAISKRLAELMGGDMGVESQLGAGSTFRFTFQTTAVAGGASSDFDPALAGRRLLVVEAHAVSRDLIGRFAHTAGLKVQAVADLASARARLAADGPFDVLVIGEELPDGNGFAWASRPAPDLPLPSWRIGYRRLNGILPTSAINQVLNKPVKRGALLRALRDGFCRQGAAAPKPAGEAADLRETARREPLSILLAEDNAVIQRVTQLMLQRLGYDVRVAANGEEALAAWREQPCDVILMDVQMPVMDGLEATGLIRRTSSHGASPWIIALTAGAMKADRARALSAGMDDFLTKPITLETLQAALSRAYAAISAMAVAI